jgi:hypothetical protein
MANDQDYVDLGLSCSDVCKALDRGLDGRRLDELSQALVGAIERLTTYVEPVTYTLSGPLTKISIAGLWPISRGISLTRVTSMRFLEPSTRRTTKI